MNNNEEIFKKIQETDTYKQFVEEMSKSAADKVVNWCIKENIIPACCFRCTYNNDCEYHNSGIAMWTMSCGKYTEYNQNCESKELVSEKPKELTVEERLSELERQVSRLNLMAIYDFYNWANGRRDICKEINEEFRRGIYNDN